MTGTLRGDRLAGRYVLVRRLGAADPTAQARDAECWIAEGEDGTRVVAKLHPAADAARRERVAIEAFAQAAAADPRAGNGVVRPLDALELGDGRSLLLLEYLPGGELSAQRGRRWNAVIPPLGPALAALAAAHRAGLAHGDLKSANLVLGADGAARLVDFGTAAFGTLPGRPSGSPYTRSPAQWRGARPGPVDDAYALGAVLHELLTGHPPFYPDVTAARVEREPVVALHSRHPVPEPLVRLTLALLDKDPAARPTLAEALGVLDAVLAAPEPGEAPSAAPLVPPSRPVRAGTESAGEEPSPGVPPAAWRPATGAAPAAPVRRRSPWPIVLGAVSAAAAIGVFLVLPRWVAERAPPPTVALPVAATPAPRAPEPGELPSDPAALAELARAKTAAEQQRRRYDDAARELTEQRAAVWGGQEHLRFTRLGETAAAAYAVRDYAAAGKAWGDGAELADTVREARAPALAAALAAGREAIARGDSRAAVAAFDRALAIEPAQAEATAGRARAERLDEVLALVDAGGTQERGGDTAAARQSYRAALALDPQAAAARAGLARLDARARADTLAAAIAQGQRALAAGRRAEARAAFDRARALDPGSPAVADALAQLDLNDRTERLSNLRTQAEAAEREERWADAVKAYDAALQIDPTVRFAQDGHARATPRAQLAARIEGVLRDPEVLAAPDARAQARAAARAAADAGPRLRERARELESLVLGYEQPVRVALASDNLTEVLVYRVGRLGSFESRELELLPGRYTIVGRRPGFRDVRREVVIAPGEGAAAVDIRCTEPI